MRSGRAREDHEQQAQITRPGEAAPDDDEHLARHDREERVDRRDREDDEVAPPLAGDPLGKLVEVEPVGHAPILAARGD